MDFSHNISVPLIQFISILQRRWPLALNGVLLVLLCWLLAQWTWLLILPKPRQASTLSAAITAPLAAEVITSRRLFGQAADLDVSVPAQTKVFSNLKLQGVFAAIGSLPAFAIVVVDGKPAQPVQVGREATSGVVLEEVHPDYVLLKRNGVIERLNLDKTASAPIRAGAEEFKLNVLARGGDSFVFSRNELNTALQDSKQLANLGRLSPYPSGGMLVEVVPPGSLAEKLGLQVGDVVQRFRNQPVRTNEDVQHFVQQLQAVNQARLDVMRAGRQMQLKYEIQQ